jgi:hypothetical protein
LTLSVAVAFFGHMNIDVLWPWRASSWRVPWRILPWRILLWRIPWRILPWRIPLGIPCLIPWRIPWRRRGVYSVPTWRRRGVFFVLLIYKDKKYATRRHIGAKRDATSNKK